MIDFLKEEKSLCAQIENLCIQNPKDAYKLVLSLICECTDEQKASHIQSAALSRICCRFLLHRKVKSLMIQVLTADDKIRKVLFGELNTYKYSLVFLLRRLIRLNNIDLTKNLLELLCQNPYRDDTAKDYSDRWSLNFLIDEALNAPQDYLDLKDENLNLIKSYKV